MITGIGSLPFRDVDEAIDIIFSTCAQIPFWPQLPKRSRKENMYIPFVEGIPFFKTTEEGSVYIEEEGGVGFEEFLDIVEGEKIEAFSIPEDLSPGFYRFLERSKEIDSNAKAIKAQITGPISMGLGIKDEKGVPVIYDEFLFDIVKKTVNMKAKWMVSEIKKHFPDKNVILFFDEPYLVAYGSVYFSLPKEYVIGSLYEVIQGINAKKGIHCCGNTDWSLVLKTNMDIVNYDAFNYLDSMFLYKEDLEDFFERDGIISPGVIPSTEDIRQTNQEDIRRILNSFLKEILKFKEKSIIEELLITPSCGLGSLEVEDARKAMGMLKEVPEIILEIFDKEDPSW